MSYKEPLSSVSSFHQFITSDSSPQIHTNTPQVEIKKYTNIAWEIEVRYDKINSTFIRQPITGLQYSLPTSIITTSSTNKNTLFSSENEHIEIDDTGNITIASNETILIQTNTSPFYYHPQPVQLYENLMSLKVTDFSERAPFAPKGELFDSHMVRFQYPLPEGEILGIPGQTGEFNRKGYRFELYNNDNYLHIPNRSSLYQSWPIIFHKGKEGKWLAIFHDNPSRTFIDLGEFYDDKVTFESLIGNTRVYIIIGKTLEETSQKLTQLLGSNTLPPLWSFGYQQSRFSYLSTTEMKKVVSNMSDHSIPLDSIYCDIDSMDNYRVFTTNPASYSDLSKTIEEFKENHIQTISIVDPGVKIDKNFSTYNELKESNGYLKNQDGSDFIGIVWPGKSLFPDFTNEKTRLWWAQQQKKWLKSYKFAGVWNDMNEPSNFDGMMKTNSKAITSIGPIKNIYNLYGFYMSQASSEGWHLYNSQDRSFIITRSGYPGVQRYAIIWHGDNYAWWEHLKLAMHTAITYSLCGSFFTGADVPGFSGNAPDDLAIRFFQLGAWLPFFRGHSIYFAKDNEPYSFNKKTTAIIKDAIILRYSLLREWYSGFQQAINTKKSPYTPIFTDKQTLITDQFLLFNKFLVAPVVEREQSKKLIYLPEGEWYHLGDTSNKLTGKQWIIMDIELQTNPVFVKAGSIITRNIVGKTTFETINNKETQEVYVDANNTAEGYWFSDDGISNHDSKETQYKLIFKNGKIEKVYY